MIAFAHCLILAARSRRSCHRWSSQRLLGHRPSESRDPQPRTGPRGFTLTELLVVIAIIGVLAAIALPAYNNYAVKSRFAEVVAASNPTKTAIAACVATGDCLVNGGLTLGSTPSSTNLVVTNGITAENTSNAAMYAAIYAYFLVNGNTVAYATERANAYVAAQQDASTFRVVGTTADGLSTCIIDVSTANGSSTCAANAGATNTLATLAQVNQYMNAASNPYYSTAVYNGGGAPTVNVPCVGSTGGCSPATKYAASVSYDSNGVVTATATSNAGLNGETFTLTPSYSSGRLDWLASGSCKTRSNGALC